MPDPKMIWGQPRTRGRVPGRSRGRIGSRVWGGIVAAVYRFGIEHPRVAALGGGLLWGTRTGILYTRIRELTLPPGATVLDAPCGSGFVLEGLRRDSRVRYVGVDISARMLARARARAERLAGGAAGFVLGDLARLPVTGGGVDVCLSFNGLHCLPDPAAALREIARALAPGGLLVGDSIVTGAGRRFDLLIALMRRCGVFGQVGTLTELASWCTATGLRLDSVERSGAVVHFAATRLP